MPLAAPQANYLQGPVKPDLCDIASVESAILNHFVLQKQELVGHTLAKKCKAHRLTKPRANTDIRFIPKSARRCCLAHT